MKRLPVILLLLALVAAPAFSYSSYFDTDCAGCHYDDSATCAGCHNHADGGLDAYVDKASYSPGETVTVTIVNSDRGGWVRGILKDETGIQVDIECGPTGTGDDGQAGAGAEFPITLTAPAPGANGAYEWSAEYFGWNYSQSQHGVLDFPVEVVVEGSGTQSPGWGELKSEFLEE